MANQPDPNTMATSFTLPRQLFAAVKRKAASEMTNQSDIVRRALMNYLPPAERQGVLDEIAMNDTTSSDPVVQKAVENVVYKIRRKRTGS